MVSAAVTGRVPASDYDLYDDKALLAPYEGYAMLRERGEVVHLTRYDLYALPRYETVRSALNDWEGFTSGEGVMLNDVLNNFMKGTLLCSDPPAHDALRKVIMRPLTPAALRALRDEIEREAQAVVERLCEQGSFNAATELAPHLPLSIVATRVGLPPVERANLLRWATAAFNSTGPMEKQRTRDAIPVLQEVGAFIHGNGAREQVTRGSWIEMLYQAADAGLISPEAPKALSFDYVGPALDTTISATSSAIWLFATHAAAWERLRQEPALIPNAINEVVRLESPIQGWSRVARRNLAVGPHTIPSGARVIMMFASANRDERKWSNPTRFDIGRQVSDHLGFGAGPHTCAGANLARMEIAAVLQALLKRVERLELVKEPVLEVNNMSRVWRDISVTVR
jgi:cytochrome P450